MPEPCVGGSAILPSKTRPGRVWFLVWDVRSGGDCNVSRALFFQAHQMAKGLTALSMLFAVLYWYISIKLFPRLGGYRLEEEADVLADGTTITSLVKLKTDDAPPLRSTLRAMMKFNRKRSGLPAAKARVSDDAAAFIGQSDKSKEEGWVWQTSAK